MIVLGSVLKVTVACCCRSCFRITIIRPPSSFFLRWKLKELNFHGRVANKDLITLIVQTCTELTSIKLESSTVDDALVNIIAQHCRKLEKLKFTYLSNIRYHSLIALSERGLPLKELDIPSIPNIPTTDITLSCSHALSCIRHLNTNQQHNTNLLIPYMTGQTSVYIDYISYGAPNYRGNYIPLP